MQLIKYYNAQKNYGLSMTVYGILIYGSVVLWEVVMTTEIHKSNIKTTSADMLRFIFSWLMTNTLVLSVYTVIYTYQYNTLHTVS